MGCMPRWQAGAVQALLGLVDVDGIHTTDEGVSFAPSPCYTRFSHTINTLPIIHPQPTDSIDGAAVTTLTGLNPEP